MSECMSALILKKYVVYTNKTAFHINTNIVHHYHFYIIPAIMIIETGIFKEINLSIDMTLFTVKSEQLANINIFILTLSLSIKEVA